MKLSTTQDQDEMERVKVNQQSGSTLDHLVEQSPRDILEHGVNEDACIAGNFFMAWPHSAGKKRQTIVRIASGYQQQPEAFQIIFDLTQEDLLDRLDFAAHDEFRISLRGAELEKLAKMPQICSLPMKLVYKRGIHVEWKHKGSDQERKMVNSWLLSDAHDINENRWFVTQDLPAKDSSTESLPSKRKRDDALNREPSPPPPRTEAESSRVTEPEEHSPRSIKKRKRMEAKRQKKALLENEVLEHAKNSVSLNNVSGPPDEVGGQGSLGGEETSKSSSTHIATTSEPPSTGVAQSSNNSIIPHSTTSALDPPPRQATGPIHLQAGFRSGGEVYTAINDIREGRTVHIIGVVTTASAPSQTRRGDWMRYIHLVDPSNCDVGTSTWSKELKINCFTKKYKEWLPNPQDGDVIILRSVKVVDYLGNLTGTGYADKLRWAAFSPSKGKIHHGQLNNVPREEGLVDGGFGVRFSPFYEPKEAEIMYCVKLSDWWLEVNKKAEVAVAEAPKQRGREVIPRTHRLISEAGPSVPPGGYFNCTVEVLKIFSESRDFVTVYVTDYTHNEQMQAVQSNWCPPALSDLVLQVEMWDKSAKIARTMQAGDFYYIDNAKMRNSSAGYLEGKVQEDKMIRLEESDASTNIDLKLLLERRKAWEAKHAKPDTDIKYCLIQDVEESKFFHCTVELVHTVRGSNQASHLYVTDYTSHPRLSTTTIGETWSKGLEGYVVKILLSDEQQALAESALVGSFYSIRKLRLRYSAVDQCFRGFLGGNEKLVSPLHPSRTDNEHLNGLLRRKEMWQRNLIQQQPNSKQNIRAVENIPRRINTPVQEFQLAERLPSTCTRIKDIDTEDTRPHKFRFFARAVDFYPLNLEDAFYQQCTRCKAEIPRRNRACLNCMDSEHEYVQYLYQLYLMIEDEDRNQITVSVNNECCLLDGLKRTYLPEDDTTRRGLCERLKPVLGNLPMVHNGLSSGKKIEVDAPFWIFDVDSWMIPGGKRAFCLSKYENPDGDI
ncbi:hypothetical protein B0H34DRAFT_695665 [Crassisporium funariophilum]|nr:hypothetical protein B0H34DRAFT_695665 [Crassisporium funariophilum]